MTSRALTPAEIALARSMFGRAIDYGKVRVHNRAWWPLQPRTVTMAPDGDLWFHPRSGLFCADFCDSPLHIQGHFIHEMTHVWQAQRSGKWWLPLMRHPFCRYDYQVAPGKPFARYGIEQQAEIVRHAFLLRRGIAVAGKPDRATYEALLPFA
ncbi:vgr related protein [Sphingobium sp. HBC34]|uniref:Vgr related protein n=1 Tax=Sphingobium cyanobacteriorum TaxID=3063954 RepID=A0ABT8ZH30_9SPHN|nr:vgr related protein [Sphingobium sp. HBC34]MDO7833852.1 vgr related protein [Sphingobium sp. HBC34]